MDAKTLEALKASIAKWERNAEAKTPAGYKTAPKNCPLCRLFFWQVEACLGCPVAKSTGIHSCGGSPYEDAWKAYANWDLSPKSSERRDRAHSAARDEVAFLKSLLPEETP